MCTTDIHFGCWMHGRYMEIPIPLCRGIVSYSTSILKMIRRSCVMSLKPTIGGQDRLQVVDEIIDLGVSCCTTLATFLICKGLSYLQWHSPDSIIILRACVCVCVHVRVCACVGGGSGKPLISSSFAKSIVVDLQSPPGR